jgi:hypothetical protein
MKNCQYCGRFFRPDVRLEKRQKSCGDTECGKKCIQDSQKQWVLKNPDYFKGRYPAIKAWKTKNPDYQKQWRKKQREIQDSIPPPAPVLTLSIQVPAKVFRGEIQDSIRLVRQCGCGFWLPGEGREIQDSMEVVKNTV